MNDEITLAGDQLDLIKRTVAKGATDDQLKLFLYTCRRTGLDPLTKQIYCVVRKGEMAIQTAIDGYRAIADGTGLYAGNEDPIFDSEEKPRKATVTVYKLVENQKCAFTATARWSQYYPGDGAQGFMWQKMPHLMLGKCAEALALRKAFPRSLSGIYTHDEMEQADKPAHDLPTPPKKGATERIPLITEVEWESTVTDVAEEERGEGEEKKVFYCVKFANGKDAWTVNRELAGKAFEFIADEGEEAKTVKASAKLGKKGSAWWLETLEEV
jgi:phage recombination protein Bet